MTNDHGDDEDEDGDDDEDEGDDEGDDDDDYDMVLMIMMLTKKCMHLDFIKCTCACLILNRARIFALLNRSRVLVKFKKKFPPNDKVEPPPMLSWNSYPYVSALYFSLDSTCLCLRV